MNEIPIRRFKWATIVGRRPAGLAAGLVLLTTLSAAELPTTNDVDELEQWIDKLADTPASYFLAGGLVAAIAANGMLDRANVIYQHLKAAECRLYTAWGVLRSSITALPHQTTCFEILLEWRTA
jgi:hypothetical protein